MSCPKTAPLGLALARSPLAASAMVPASNAQFVVNAVTELCFECDLTPIDRDRADSHMQRHPGLALTSAVQKDALGDMPERMGHKIGTVIVDGDICRVKTGKIAKHWDVGQAVALETASDLPIFEPMR